MAVRRASTPSSQRLRPGWLTNHQLLRVGLAVICVAILGLNASRDVTHTRYSTTPLTGGSYRLQAVMPSSDVHADRDGRIGRATTPPVQSLRPMSMRATQPSETPTLATPPLTHPPVSVAAKTPSSRAVHATQPMSGPLCVFVPANGHDEKHLAETVAVLEAWGDDSTLLFTENPVVMNRTEDVAKRRGVARVLVEMESWKQWQAATILAQASLRRRGATNQSLRGRGQLSIPMFYWISQLVKSNDTLVQNCKWFMKCDTDTFLRRELLERTQLATLDPRQRLHVGVPLSFNTRPYHTTFRFINFQYNIGGPGYTFSRGLMEALKAEECIESMTKDPVLLIHDDVATGYCATYHVTGSSTRINVNATVTSSLAQLVQHLVEAGMVNNSTRTTNGSVGQKVTVRPAITPPTSCIDCTVALHPVAPQVMALLAARDRETRRRTSAIDSSFCTAQADRCTLKFMLGTYPVVGNAWTLDNTMNDVAKFWMLRDIRAIDFTQRKAGQAAKDLIAEWSKNV